MEKSLFKATPVARLFCMLMFLALSQWTFAQSMTVSGQVTDSDGMGIPGVTVVEVGTTNGTISDVDGNYSIAVEQGSQLQFSFIGYGTETRTIGTESVLNIAMSTDNQVLEEVVVTGYSAQQKKDLTGAVATLDSEELTAIPSPNVTSQLQGRVSGVTTSGDGRPGQAAKVRIRGFSSFTGANNPLYVVDGVPTQDISTINPSDIESMSVLKDAGAASIYGSRASNGVILITTKSGSEGVKVGYSMYYGTQNPGAGNTNLLNTQQYADLQWLVYRNDGTEETHPVYGASSNANPTLPSWAADTDWWGILTQNGAMANHDLSLSAGTKNAKFYAGLNYFGQEGIIIHNFLQRYSARINSEFKVANGRLTIGENITVTGRNGNGAAGNGSESSVISQGLYRAQPIVPHIIPEGTTIEGTAHTYVAGEYGGTGIAPRLGNGGNMFASQERNRFDRGRDVRVLGSMFADLKIIEGLNLRSTFGGTYQNGYNTNWTPATYENAENTSTPSYNENAFNAADYVWTNTLTYNQSFADVHNLLAVVGYESVKYGIGRSFSATAAGYFSNNPAFRTLSNGATIVGAFSGYNTPTTLVSQFARVDYSFDNRYYLSGTIRRDGSSRFSPSNRYGIFPSVSAGVRVSDFLNLAFLDDLKIRGGYGQMGNQLPVSPANQFNLYGGEVNTSYYDLGGTSTSSEQGFRPTRLGNENTKWETQITTNIGFDASMLNSKLQMTFDWYRKDAKDLLVNIPLPAIYGNAFSPALNIGDMKNSGIDVLLEYRDRITNDLGFRTSVTFTTYRNEILKFTDDVDFFASGDSRIGAFNRNEVGRSISEFYGYNVIGLFQDDADVASSPDQDGAEPGFFKYADTDGDGEITPDDRVFLGNPNPDFTYGLNLGFDFKGIEIDAFLFGSQGNDIFNYNRWWTDFWPSFQGQKSIDLLENSWTPDNKGATVPKASNVSNFSTNTVSNSYYIEDGSFLRLRNLRIGYSISPDLTRSIGISNAKVYVQGSNLFTLTGYTGLDADVNNSGSDTSFGVDHGNYPLVQSYIFGLQIGF